jgi:hypothetical protein
VLHLFPEAAIMQVGVIEESLRGSHRAPGEAAFLGSVVDLLCRQAGNEIGDEIIDDVRCVRCNDCLFRILEIAGHAVGVQQLCQVPDVLWV